MDRLVIPPYTLRIAQLALRLMVWNFRNPLPSDHPGYYTEHQWRLVRTMLAVDNFPANPATTDRLRMKFRYQLCAGCGQVYYADEWKSEPVLASCADCTYQHRKSITSSMCWVFPWPASFMTNIPVEVKDAISEILKQKYILQLRERGLT